MRYLSSISLALIVLMALACTAPPPANTPNIDATVEARLAEEKTAEPPTPTPFKHHPLLSPEQVYKILEQYISNTVKKEELSSRAFDCLYWYHGPFFYSVLDGDGHERSVIEWSYMDDNSDRWILTTVGD